jgi:microcystin-dependent protein
MVMYFANSTAPGGWLQCNGAAVSRITYADLFDAIGIVYGSGDGLTTFNIPDLRGEFIRAWDAGRGVDPSRAIGSTQTDELKSHTHTIIDVSSSGSYQNANIAGTNITWSSRQTGATGGTETRPRNVAMMACIKF